jgi:ABC-type multidrug transport system ATPase subunit
MGSALQLRNIRKVFGRTVAVEDLDLVVPRGALYGVFGPSGAGKTTCIRMIMSILFPDSGTLTVLDGRSGWR